MDAPPAPALWSATVQPADCVDFGLTLAEMTYGEKRQGVGFDDRALVARHVVYTALSQPPLSAASPQTRVERALQLTCEIFIQGAEPDEDAPEPFEAEYEAQHVTTIVGVESCAPRIWSTTEADSSALISMPVLVERLRRNLSLRRPVAATWDDLLALGRRITFPLKEIDPNATDLSTQLWLLAAAWLFYVYPGTPGCDCIEFGRAVVEVAYRTPHLPGAPDQRFAGACARVREALRRPNVQAAPMPSRVDLLLTSLQDAYDSQKRWG